MQETADTLSWRVTEPWTMMTDKYLSSANAPEIEEDVRLCVASGAYALTLDCAPLIYMTSAGLRTLLKIAQMLQEVDGTFSVSNLKGQPRDIFLACGIDSFIPITDADALPSSFSRVA